MITTADRKKTGNERKEHAGRTGEHAAGGSAEEPMKRHESVSRAIPATAARVPEHSPQEAEELIRQSMVARVQQCAERLERIKDRLAKLEGEWDIERTLETNAAVISLVGLALGALWRKWNWLPATVAFFLLQHAVQGWCPPVEMFRRMGIRTMREIDEERFALKALRGDFHKIDAKQQAPAEAAKETLAAVAK